MTHPTTTPPLSGALEFPTSRQPRRYAVQTDTLSVLGNWQYENTTDSVYQLTYLSASPEAGQVEVKRTQFKQTNSQGFSRLDGDVARLADHLLLRLAPTGQLTNVLNRADLQERFRALRPNLKLRYLNDPQITPALIDNLGTILDEEGHLERILTQSPELGLLLPPLVHQTFPTEPAPGTPGTKVLANVFSTLALPLLTRTRRIATPPDDVAISLQVEGQFDQTQYAFDDARKAMQTLTGQIDVDPTPTVQYLESYEFDTQHHLLHAGRLAVYGVPGVFMTKIVTTVRLETSR